MHIIVMNAIAAPAPQRGLLDCPACGSQRVVLTHLDCRALGSTSGEVQIGRDGLRIDPAIPDPEGGATVGLRCTCEQGHDTVIRFRQLRDATVVERTVLPILTHSHPAWRPGRTTPLHKALLSTGELESDPWRRGCPAWSSVVGCEPENGGEREHRQNPRILRDLRRGSAVKQKARSFERAFLWLPGEDSNLRPID